MKNHLGMAKQITLTTGESLQTMVEVPRVLMKVPEHKSNRRGVVKGKLPRLKALLGYET